jgi:hypothetical protein
MYCYGRIERKLTYQPTGYANGFTGCVSGVTRFNLR